MFTTSCFIRKNTPELRARLEELGYKIDFHPYEECTIILTLPKIKYAINSRKKWAAFDDAIDCGENEDLFLALAAMKDDSDYMQWFVSDGIFTLCQNKNCEFPIRFKKATVEELIEHFNK